MRRAVLATIVVLGPAAPLLQAQGEPPAVQSVVLRNSFSPFGSGARGLGMGGAFTAVADDGTAGTFNPAGLAQLRGSELTLVGFRNELVSEVDPGSRRTRSHARPDFAGVAVPFEVGRRHLTVQLAYQRAVGLTGEGAAVVSEEVDLADDVGLPLDGTGTVTGEIFPSQQGALHNAVLAVGLQATPRLAVGVSANAWIGEWTATGESALRLRAPRLGVDVELVRTVFEQQQSLRGLSTSAGLLLRYPRLTVGAVARLPFRGDYTLRETREGTRLDLATRQAIVFEDDAVVRSVMHWPRSVAVGLAVRPLRGLTLAADLAFFSWSRARIDDLPGGALLTDARERIPVGGGEHVDLEAQPEDRNFFDLEGATETLTEDTRQLRAGAEYLLLRPRVVIPLRAGIFRDRSPVVDPDSGRGRPVDGWTIGTGLNFARVVLDVAFERRSSEGPIALRFTPGGVPVASERSPRERVRESRVVFSLILRAAGANDPLSRLFRYLFVGDGE